MFMRRKEFDKDKAKGKGMKKKGRPIARRRICRFCADTKLVIDYKEGKLLTPFTTERGRIVPRRISGNCAKHQREVTLAIKRARILALIPFSATQVPLI
jgi:small subunit ribosomal protein S18